MSEEKIQLDVEETLMVIGQQAREKQVIDQYLMPIRRDWKVITDKIELRLKLPSGTIGTRYLINGDHLVKNPNYKHDEEESEAPELGPVEIEMAAAAPSSVEE